MIGRGNVVNVRLKRKQTIIYISKNKFEFGNRFEIIIGMRCDEYNVHISTDGYCHYFPALLIKYHSFEFVRSNIISSLANFPEL